MTPEQAQEISNKLNEHTGQLLAIQAVLLSLTAKVVVDQKFVAEIIEKTPLSGDKASQNQIRLESKQFVLGLITQHGQ